MSDARELIEGCFTRVTAEQRKLDRPALTDLLFQASATLAEALRDCELPKTPAAAMRWIEARYLRASSFHGNVFPRLSEQDGIQYVGFSFALTSPYAPLVPNAPGYFPYHINGIERRGLVRAPPQGQETTFELLVPLERAI